MKTTAMKTTTVLFVMLTTIAASIGSAMADSQWAKNHPRRDQVNDRLHNQNQRIHNEVKQGDMSKRKAARLHHEDHAIHNQERRMASKNGGAITPQEQQRINQEENHVSQQIGH